MNFARKMSTSWRYSEPECAVRAGFAAIVRGVLLLIMIAFYESTVDAADVVQPVVLGYYPSWNAELPPQKVNYGLFTLLIHAFISINDQGDNRTEGNLPSQTLTKLAHQAGVQVLVAVGGAGSGANLGKMMKSDQAARDFVQKVILLVKDNGYDGVDVDWEFPESTDQGAQLVNFVEMVRRELKSWNSHSLLTMAVPATDWSGKWFIGARLEPNLDFIQVMSYDVHGPWKEGGHYSHSGHNAPLHETDSDPIDGNRLSFERFARYWESKGFPKSKIVMGIPCFGHGFAVGEWGKEPERKARYPDVKFTQIKGFLASGWTRKWDAQSKVPWLVSPDHNEMISYDDEESSAAKGQWAKQAGVRGIFFWEISQDYVDSENRIVNAARAGFGLR
jgi:chitinase